MKKIVLLHDRGHEEDYQIIPISKAYWFEAETLCDRVNAVLEKEMEAFPRAEASVYAIDCDGDEILTLPQLSEEALLAEARACVGLT